MSSWSSNRSYASAGEHWAPQLSQWWQCKVCEYWTPSQTKKCKGCGIKKSWAQTVTGGIPWNPSQQSSAGASLNTVRTQLDVTTSQEQNGSNPSHSIKALENALAQVPTGEAFAATRDVITSQIADLKKNITRSKPMGAQLDSCKAAIERATKRKQNALEAAEKAHKDLQEAENQIEYLQKDLIDLEAQVANHHNQDTIQQNVAQVDSVQSMADALQKVLIEMNASPTVPQETVAQAGQYMTALMSGIQNIANTAQQAAAQHAQPLLPQASPMDFHDAAENVETDGAYTAIPRRMQGKSANGCVRSDPYTNPEVFQMSGGAAAPL